MTSPPRPLSSPHPTITLPPRVIGAPLVAESAPYLVWHTLSDGQVDFVNAEWCAYTSLSLAASRGAGWQQAVHPDDLVRLQAIHERGDSSSGPGELAYRLRRADGVYGWFLGRIEAICTVDGQIAGWVGTAAATVDGLSSDQGPSAGSGREPVSPEMVPGPPTFVAAAAHDLKNELAVVRGTAQLLERRERREAALEPERVLAGLAQIVRSTTKMQLLVEEFLDLSRLQRGQPVEFNLQPTDLVALARDCVETYAPTTNHELTFFATAEPLVGDWDAARLERVIANLLTNAIKYSAPIGTIRLAIAREGTGSGANAVLTVQDSGVGIPAQDLPRLFTPFFRAGNVAHSIPGTGIGLFGARAIIEQQGGTLTLASTEGIGTTATVRLPLAD